MRTTHGIGKRAALGVAAAALSLAAVTAAEAVDYTWDASGGAPLDDGAGAWSSSGGSNWETGGSYGAWGNSTNDTAIIGVGNGAAGTITVSTPITLNGLTFNAAGAGNYTLSSNTLSFGGTNPTIDVNSSATIQNGRDTSISLASGVDLTIDIAPGEMLTTRKLIVTDQNSDVIVTGGGTLGVQFEGWNPFLANVNGSGSSTLFIQSNSTVRLVENFHAISDFVRVDIAGGSTFDLNGKNEGVGYISGGGRLLHNGAATAGFILDCPSFHNNADFSGVISGSGGVTLRGNGAGTSQKIQIFSGTNTYTGNTAINNVGGDYAEGLQLRLASASGAAIQGNVTIGNDAGGNKGAVLLTAQPNQFGSNSVVTLDCVTNGYSYFILDGNNQTIAGLSSTGSSGRMVVENTENGSVADATLTINNAAGFAYGGIIQDNGGGTGTLSVTKIGSGTQTLSGTNTYSGTTAVSNGVLHLAAGASLGMASVVRVSAPGKLQLDTGVNPTVLELWLDDVLKVPGTWGAPGSGAEREDNHFLGDGILTVTTGAPTGMVMFIR